MLTFSAFAIEQFGIKHPKDRRRRVNRLVVSYKDAHGIEYRKSFFFPRSTPIADMQSRVPKIFGRNTVTDFS